MTGNFYSLFQDEIPQRPILIAPFVREGDLVLITGDRGSGKTTWAADLIRALVCPPNQIQGQSPDWNLDGPAILHWDAPMAGLFRVDKDLWANRTAIILDAENDMAEWRMLMEDSFRRYGILKNSSTLSYIGGGIRWHDADQYCWDDLSKNRHMIDMNLIPALIEHNAGLVLIDSLHKLWRRNLNEPDWVNYGLGHLRRRCRENHITIVALTHTSRNFKDKLEDNKGLPSFTSQQEKEADTILYLKRLKADPILQVKLVKRRYAKWNAEDTVAKVVLSDTFGSYKRVVHNPWTREDERPRDPDAMIRTEQTLLDKFPEVPILLSHLKGHTGRNAEILPRLLSLGMVAVHSEEPKLYQITPKGLNHQTPGKERS